MIKRVCRLAPIVVVVSALVITGPWSRAETPPAVGAPMALSRQEFAARMRSLKPGMTEAQVAAVLGKADYVGRFDDKRFPIAWFYGCTGPRKLPLLGSIWFDNKQLTTYPLPGDWPPPAPDVISKADLRKEMLILDQAPGNDPVDPGTTIRVVNALLPFGKTKLFAAIREYIRVVNDYRHPDLSIDWKEERPAEPGSREAMYEAGKMSGSADNGILFLLRLMFDFPPKASAGSGDTLPIPIPMIGGIAPPPPFNQTLAPRFPVVLVDDVPLLELIGISMGGMPEPLTDILPLFEQRGRLRTQPLRPTDHPELILSDLKSSPQWLFDKRYRVPTNYGMVIWLMDFENSIRPSRMKCNRSSRAKSSSCWRRSIRRPFDSSQPTIRTDGASESKLTFRSGTPSWPI